MSRSALSLMTSRLRRAISSCSGFISPWPGNACCGSSVNFFAQSRSCDCCTPRSCEACVYDTPRSLIRRTASSLNSRVNFRRSMSHLRSHCHTKLGVFGTGGRPDSLNEVEFWIRNVSQHINSFRLPVASGNFYPDFVAKLKDGRFFVVEYKGESLAGSGVDDTNEKRAIGLKWERASDGGGIFAVIEKDVAGRDMRRQLIDKIDGKH